MIMRDTSCWVTAISMLFCYSTMANAEEDWIRLNLDVLENVHPPTVFDPLPKLTVESSTTASGEKSQPHPMLEGTPNPKTLALSLQTQKHYPFGIIRLKIDRSMRIRGWELRNKTYVGQTKVGSEWGVGVLFVRESYSWGVNNRGLSVIKKF